MIFLIVNGCHIKRFDSVYPFELSVDEKTAIIFLRPGDRIEHLSFPFTIQKEGYYNIPTMVNYG